ncbi:MAG: septum formation initiator family protein [Pygmaiobacter sp.]
MTKNPKRSCGSALLLRVAVVGIVGYLAVTLIASQVDIMVKRQQLDAMTTNITRQEQENTELQRLIASGDEMDYIERIARDRLGYAAPGERVFIDISGK